MRKAIIFLILIFGLIALFRVIRPTSEIRVRIIPNSNEAVDLEIKDEVKLLTVKYLQKNFNDDRDTYINNINNTINEFNTTLSSYNAKGELVNHQFYQKKYENKAIKDDEYLTFLVEIGSSSGDNWWGVIYPKFLEINSSEANSVKSYFYEKIKKWLRS